MQEHTEYKAMMLMIEIATTTPKASSTSWWTSSLSLAPSSSFPPLEFLLKPSLISYTRMASSTCESLQHRYFTRSRSNAMYRNMIGHPKHVKKCLDLGADLICAQGGEGGGHTGDTPTSVLIPAVKQLCEGKTSPMTGKPVQVVAAGGIFNGQSLASVMALGATAVWVGTRFVLSEVRQAMIRAL